MTDKVAHDQPLQTSGVHPEPTDSQTSRFKQTNDIAEDILMTIEGPEALQQVQDAAEQQTDPGTFDRAISEVFVAKLQAEAAKSGWWADVLADNRLFVALRGTYLNVYWRGQSIFRVQPNSAGLKVTTHEKFLLDPALASQVSLLNGQFDIARLLQVGFIRNYEGKPTIAKLKKASGLYAGPGKTGCHEIAVRNSTVIDSKVVLPALGSSVDGGKNKRKRIDLACLETAGDDAKLVFWDAMDYSNPKLRLDLQFGTHLPSVFYQLEQHKESINAHREAILDSYRRVAENLTQIHSVKSSHTLSPLIAEVGSGTRRLLLDEPPKVGLIIFGYDEAAKLYPGWQAQLKQLQECIPHIITMGDAKSIKLPQ